MSHRVAATQISKHGSNRDDMRRDAKSLLNRLRSIQADSAFVLEIADLFPQFPLLANERCGTWYAHPARVQKPGVYFKSTDGHTGIWDFNLRRYNSHLITTIIENGGCIVVDSTRKGKRVPDALSKTIPIWCATINNAVRKCALQNQAKQQQQKQQINNNQEEEGGSHSTQRVHIDESDSESSLLIPSLDAERWDTRYHSLPSLISRSEHAQIAEKIDGFAEKLMLTMRFSDLTFLTMRLRKPIRPIWLTPQSFLFKDDMPDYSDAAFLPVICLSASRVVPEGMEERDGYLYVQGSGDDEDMWSSGLTPDLFWENEDYLLEEGIAAAECEGRVREIVQNAKKQLRGKSQHRQINDGAEILSSRQTRGNGTIGSQPRFTPSMELCSEIMPSAIWIGNNASARIPDCWHGGFDMVINCAAEIQRDPLFEAVEGSQHVTRLSGNGVNEAQASLCIMQQHQWERALNSEKSSTGVEVLPRDPQNKDFYYLHLPIAEGKKGQHQLLEMIPVAIKAVRSVFTSRLTVDTKAPSPKILVHCQQGMDRSVGIALALLVSCFDENTGVYCGEASDQMPVTKEAIQKRLFQIMSHRLAARPSRATLKMVNTHFMSPADPPPAKYKQASSYPE
ncbi:hypothetical protein EDD11_010279 [Mortierella claussenii]|nr:hypothetical protein EDD11_010279 [Mortierella claussenii]